MRTNSIKLSFVYILSLLAIVSCLQEERSPEDILVPSPAQVETSDASLMLASKVPSGSERLVQECGFYYSKDKSMSDTRKVAGVLAANNFTAELPDRTYGTTYYICAYVTNGHGSDIRSDLRSYELGTLDSYIEFGEVSLLSHDLATKQTSITVGADIWDGVVVSETGVCYGTEPSSLNIDGARETGSYDKEGGLIAVVLKDMTEATQYYLRPYVKDGDYLSYGEVVPFYIPAVAKVSTFDAEAVTASGATLSGEVTDECGSAVTERGFAWIEGDAVPTIEDSFVPAGSGLGAMTATVEGLDPNKKYTFRAYAMNASGTAYGEAKVFTTLVALPSLAASTVSNITSTSATFNGVLANNGGESVSEVGFYYSTEKEVNPETAQKVSLEYSTYQKSAKELSANTLYSAMQSAQAAASDEGEAFSIDVFSLGIKTKYYVKSYAVNSAGVAYGSVISFETAGEIATIKTVGSSEVTTSTALLSASITADNGEKITERGFVWMEGAGNPTTDSNKLKVSGEVGEYTATLEGLDPNKKYSFRAYAINAEGTAYGDVMSFTTKVALPALSSVVISSITSTSATISSKVANHGGETVVEVGFYYSTDESLNLETATKVSLPYSADSFSADIADLLVNTKYYVKSFAKNSAGIEYSELETFTTSISFPSVKTVGSSDITSTSALLSGIVVSDNGASITERGFVWLQGTGTPTTDSFKLKVDGEVGEYSTTLEGLDPNQKYSFRAYAINSKGTAYGEIMTFSTVVGLPVLSTVDVADITATSAIVTADVEDKGGESITEVGFYYSTEETVDIESSVKVKKNYTGNAFSASLDELQIFADYYVKAYAVNSAGVAYSDVVSFKTLASTPVVNTVGASEITPTSAVLSGTVATDNGAAITERGFVYLKGTEAPTTSSNKVKVEGTLGDFTASLADLEPNQKYSYRAYAINAKGTSYGDIMNFSTSVSLPALSAMKVSSITTTSATFTCTVTNHGGETVSEVGFYYSKEESVDVETAQKISEVYSSDAFTLKAEDLEIGQNYYVKAYTKNSIGEVYSAVVSFKTTSTAPSVSTIGYTKLSATSAELSGQVLDDNGENITERGFVWVKGTSTPTTSSSKQSVEGTVGDYTATVTDLEPNQIYSFRAYAINSKGTAYGDVMQLQIAVTLPTVTTNDVTSITNTTATSGGVITSDGGGEILAKGIVWSITKNPTIESSNYTDEGDGVESFTNRLTDLRPGFTYYVRAYAANIMGIVYGETKTFTTTGEIQSVFLEAANSFIVSDSDAYSFKTVKGNSSESVGEVATSEVLWETFGTEEYIEEGDLIAFVSYNNGTITFATADNYREGNAVIAAKDALGTILWSWHIWLTDQPEEQVYNNGAGAMMDRNLGATSATPGDVCALGLLYQWGRKDPFLGASSILSNTEAKSTLTWPSKVSSNSSNGTIEYSISHPTTFITRNTSNDDWYYTGSSNTDDTRWQPKKTIYDPCPVGWRIPNGGESGIWSTALGSDSPFSGDSSNEGMNLSEKFGSAPTIWYPASGYRGIDDGALCNVGSIGYYMSVTPYSNKTYHMWISDKSKVVHPSSSGNRANGYGVRCFKEGTGGGVYVEDFSTYRAIDLSGDGTANSYIVSNAGMYSIPAVKGNSNESVGSVSSVDVLWESFGTEEQPIKGSLVKSIKYENDRIYFITADSYREGNVVIAAKDQYGTILWSWHIWLTDQPQEQVYYNKAGTMMDRNLGATSATPGDVGALGLLYQWGRKDPFLGSSSISESIEAKSTFTWPPASSYGDIEYSISHPTTFITRNTSNDDWYYTSLDSTDNTRWQSEKTIYDPCPVGWRVPDGGENGIWSKALGSCSYFEGYPYDSSNSGMNFSGKFGSDSIIWYPASGYRNFDGSLGLSFPKYWSVTPFGSNAYGLAFYDIEINLYDDEYRAYGYGVRCFKEGTGGEVYAEDFSTVGTIDLSSNGTANSYIVSNAGTYSISAVKGNSNESVGPVSSVNVLWESFGTEEQPIKESLVKSAKYENDRIYFITADSYREGNVVIAAKDQYGTILWSWHIWLTDQPQEQVYYNNAGTMMDRNLGATSATPGDVGALGLLYQWGRKDPFLGSSSISGNSVANSTITWPSAVSSDSSTGTVDYVTSHPTTFITYNDSSLDWYYTGSNSRWQSEKTIYDPCPVGWRVPDGGSDGVWSKALGSSLNYTGTYDSTNEGMNFSGNFSDASTIWYPASGYRDYYDGALNGVGYNGIYWSASPGYNYACSLSFGNNGGVFPSNGNARATGFSVRCLQESE